MSDDWREGTWQQYQTAGLGQSAGWGERPALLIVDLCYGMTDPASPLGGDFSDAIAATLQVAEVCRARDLPVIYTTVAYSRGAKDGGAFVKKVPSLRIFEEGNGGEHWSQIDERIAPRPTEPIINKRFASAFFGTNLHSLLTAERVDTVIVTGSTTSGCVRASALDALQCGFNVIVPRECVADRAAAPHEASLFDLDAKYADVLSVADVLAHLKR